MWGRRRAWLVLLAVALAVRLAVVLAAADYRSPWLWEAEIVARALVTEGIFGFDWFGRTPPRPSAFLPPVYPAFVAASMWVGGEGYRMVLHVSQALLSVVSVALIVPLAQEIGRSTRAAWLAGAIAAVYPTFVFACAQISTVTLEVLLIELVGLGLLRWRRLGAPRWMAVSGVSLGLLVLTRAPAALLWPLVAAWTTFVLPIADRRRRASALLVLTICMVATLLPWAARNYVVLGTPALATNAGYNFWVGHNPAAEGEFDSTWASNQPIVDRVTPLSEPQRDREYFRLAIEYIVTHPAEELNLSLRKLAYFLWFRPNVGSSFFDAGDRRALAQAAVAVSYGAVLLGAVVGIWLTRHRWRELFVLYGVWLAYAASAVAFFVATRYRAPVEPFLVIFAALAVDRIAARRWRAPT